MTSNTNTTTATRKPISAKERTRRLTLRGARVLGAEKRRNGWVYYDEGMRAWYLVSSSALAFAGEMDRAGSWEYSEWCACTTARELRSR